MKLKLGIMMIALALNSVSIQFANAAPAYSLFDLGVLPGYDSSVAYDVNDRGQVTGSSYLALHSDHESAFRYDGANMAGLGALGGWRSTAKAINNSGIVVGEAMSADGSMRAYRYGQGMVDLGYPGQALGVNDAGIIVGATTTGLFVKGTSVAIDMSSLNARWGWDINNRGDFVGTTSEAYPQGYVFSSGTLTLLGRLGSGQVSNAYAVNDLGDVVGESLTGGSSSSGHAFLWTRGAAMLDLGVVGPDAQESVAWDINDRREVVGTLRLNPGRVDTAHGFYWNDGVMYDLNDLLSSPMGYTIVTANAINSLGQIAGSAIAPSGFRRAVLLTPMMEVPEPSSVALVVIGFLTMVRRANRHTPTRRHPSAIQGVTRLKGSAIQGVKSRLVLPHRLQTTPGKLPPAPTSSLA